MIKLTRLSGDAIVVNAEYIKFIEKTPDTMITLRDGDKLIVRESVDELIRASTVYLRSLHAPEVL